MSTERSCRDHTVLYPASEGIVSACEPGMALACGLLRDGTLLWRGEPRDRRKHTQQTAVCDECVADSIVVISLLPSSSYYARIAPTVYRTPKACWTPGRAETVKRTGTRWSEKPLVLPVVSTIVITAACAASSTSFLRLLACTRDAQQASSCKPADRVCMYIIARL